MDLVFLSRLQFGLTTAFHILFPTLTVGLAVFLVVVELMWLKTGQEIYYRIYRYWVKLFAINFAVGVVSGITLEFEFGTNFARFSQAVANVVAPLMAYEGMTAFFLEAGFLGIMLFGWNRVPRTVHFLATCLVALGAMLSAFWILAANAWMQTPAGYELVNGKFHIVSFTDAIFNPAFPTQLSHMLIASFETSAFAVAGISAWYLLRDDHAPFFRRSMGLALIMAALFAPLQVFVGDLRGLNMAKHQPAKLAATEARWETNTEGGAPFLPIAFPDMKAEKNRFQIAIPNGLSLLITHSMDGKIPGLKDFPRDERPNAAVIFWTFRAMAGIGFLFVAVMVWAAFLWRRKRLYATPLFLKTLLVLQPVGFVATVAGWITAEMGRQPWTVYGLLRTTDGVSPIAAGNVAWSLAMFSAFFMLIGASYFYYVFRTIRLGPDMESPIPPLQRPAGFEPSRSVEVNP